MEFSLKNIPLKPLEFGDVVRLQGTRYQVHDSFLGNMDRMWENSEIFDRQGLNQESILYKAYGYAPGGGCWNTCRDNDYEALTRAVWLLLSLELKPEDLNNLDSLIDPVIFIKNLPDKLPEIAGSKQIWISFEEFGPRIASLVSGFNFLNMSGKEYLEILK